jgi:TPR repeat protein
MVAEGRGTPANDAYAVALYERACVAGVAEGCDNLGFMLASGRGAPRDDARAASLFRAACDRGNAGGCYNLGMMYRQGRALPPRPGSQNDTNQILSRR